MSREQFIKERVKKGYSGRKILRELRKAKYSIGNDKFWELMRKYRKSDEIMEEVIKELLGKGYSGRQIGDELRDKRKFELSNDRLYKLIRKHRRFVCVKDNILDLVERHRELGLGNYPLTKKDILELTEHCFFGVYSECETFRVIIYIGQSREEELTFSKLKYLYHLILTKVPKLKLREGCCEGGTELENFTLQLAFRYDDEYVFDERDLCKKLLYDILEILSDKTCREGDEEGVERWFKYLENYIKKTEEW
jgi:hypothetical protein